MATTSTPTPTPALAPPTTDTPTAILGGLGKTSTSTRVPQPNTAWFAPSSMQRSVGPAVPTVPQALVRQFTTPSVQVQPRAMRAGATWPLARSASTTPSSSSLASPWVRLCPSSLLLGPIIPATTLTVSSVVAVRL